MCDNMSESYIQIPEDSIGKKLRTEEVFVNGNSVHQEIMTIANPNGDKIYLGYTMYLIDDNGSLSVIFALEKSTNFVYDVDGNLTEIHKILRKPDGSEIEVKKTFTYDSNGNLTDISGWVKV